MVEFDISNQGLTTLKDVDFPVNVTELDCWANHLTSLEHCPPSVTKLDCWGNQLSSLEHCPPSVTKLDCEDNHLTSLEDCPPSVTKLDCDGNRLNAEYAHLSLSEIHKLNKKKFFLKGLAIVQRLIQNNAAKKIQKTWQRWWYDELDQEGINRLAKYAVADLNHAIIV